MDPYALLLFFPMGYLATVALEAPWLLLGLSKDRTIAQRIIASFWLTACTYPVVAVVLPLLLSRSLNYWGYLVVAEGFAILTECSLYHYAFRSIHASSRHQDTIVITTANICSLTIGSVCLHSYLQLE